MPLSQDHALEVFWLKRRIQFLEILDDLIKNDAGAEEFFAIARHFKKVENPKELFHCIESIYGKKVS